MPTRSKNAPGNRLVDFAPRKQAAAATAAPERGLPPASVFAYVFEDADLPADLPLAQP